MEKDFYTVKEFAKAFGCSTDRVYEWLRTEIITFYERPTPHSIYRIPKTELERLKIAPSKRLDHPVQTEVVKEAHPGKAVERTEPVQHFAHLVDMVNLLLSNDVGKIVELDEEISSNQERKYTIHSEISDWKTITHSSLVERIGNNIELSHKTYSSYDFWECLVPHLLAETVKYRDFNYFYEESTIEFINLLRMLSLRKTFKGICPVCNDWVSG